MRCDSERLEVDDEGAMTLARDACFGGLNSSLLVWVCFSFGWAETTRTKNENDNREKAQKRAPKQNPKTKSRERMKETLRTRTESGFKWECMILDMLRKMDAPPLSCWKAEGHFPYRHHVPCDSGPLAREKEKGKGGEEIEIK